MSKRVGSSTKRQQDIAPQFKDIALRCNDIAARFNITPSPRGGGCVPRGTGRIAAIASFGSRNAAFASFTILRALSRSLAGPLKELHAGLVLVLGRPSHTQPNGPRTQAVAGESLRRRGRSEFKNPPKDQNDTVISHPEAVMSHPDAVISRPDSVISHPDSRKSHPDSVCVCGSFHTPQ